MTKTIWTSEQDKILKRVVEGGLSFAECAAHLNAEFGTNYSRNACIGRAHRQGFKSPNTPFVSNKRARKWTRDMDTELIKALTVDGRSYNDAAARVTLHHMPVSRDACIKRARRLAINSVATSKESKVAQKKQPGPKMSAEVIQLRCAEVVPLHLSLLDLEPHQCRYPYGERDFTFCGQTNFQASSYCQAHSVLVRGERPARPLEARERRIRHFNRTGTVLEAAE